METTINVVSIFVFCIEKKSIKVYNVKDFKDIIGGIDMASTKEKSIWILIVFILSGIVVGGLIGEIAGKTGGLWWLGYGQEFGIKDPLTLDLSVLKISFSLLIKLNISSILGMIIAIVIYRKCI